MLFKVQNILSWALNWDSFEKKEREAQTVQNKFLKIKITTQSKGFLLKICIKEIFFR